MRKACITFVLFLAACGGDDAAPRPNGAAPPRPEPAVAGTPAPITSGWDERAGPALLVAGEQPEEVFVVFPQQGDEADSLEVAEYTGREVTLIGRQGVTGAATLSPATPLADDEACAPWPRVAAPGVATPWTVGFVRASIEAVTADSLHALASRDSSRFVADVARLASTLPGTRKGDHAASFQGLPFVVKDAARFPTSAGQAAVAHVVRRVNQEANPLEEHTFLILERDGEGDPWRVAYSDHSVGHEETVRREELLGIVSLGGQLTLVLALDDGEGVAYALVQRAPDGRWRQAWLSRRAAC